MEAYPHPVRTEWKLLALLRKDNPGITQEDCARQLGVSALTISHWTKKPLYQSYENWLITQTFNSLSLPVKISKADLKEKIDEYAEEMLERLKDIVETSTDHKLIASIGWDILDRAGYDAPKAQTQRNIQLVLTPETLQMLATRASEIANHRDVIVGEVVGHPL